MRQRIAMTISFLTMLGLVYGFGQKSPDQMRTKVPFEFRVEGTVLPAGNYEFRYDPARPWVVILRNSEDNKTIVGRIITLLARDRSSQEKTRLVFDTVGEQHYLSEVWLPGRDGFLLRGKAEKHKHEVINAEN